jgi:hypothetical protein
MPPAEPSQPTEVCPGCGAVLVPMPGSGTAHSGASPSCSRLWEVTLAGLREETGADPAAAATVALADDAYAAQHPAPGDPAALRAALDRLHRSLRARPVPDAAEPPARWRTTIADVAADLDVIDLPVLVESWARSVLEDWTAAAARPTRR